jgi:catechol 2,3-dioxygenase-like lactoylglutathione lyase family enzyme
MKKLVEIARFVEDVDRTAAFYERLLEAEPVARSEGMAIFMLGETKLFLHQTYQPGEGELPPENHLAFEVEDLDQTCLELTASGLTIELPPDDYYWGRSAYLRDPDGQLIELTESNQPTPGA